MKSKTWPLLALLAAALFFFWIKWHQRGKGAGVTTETATAAYTALRGNNKTLIYSRHAKCRMACRQIDEQEVMEILEKGAINLNRIEEDERGKTYPIEGRTQDGQHVRIVFAPKENEIVVVTAIDLENETQCNCN